MSDGYVDVKEKDTGKLAFRYNPVTKTVEVQRRTTKRYFRLTDYEPERANEREQVPAQAS